MTKLEYQVLRMAKRVPLRISRGLHTHSELIWLRWSEADVEGWGECVPYEIGGYGETMSQIQQALDGLAISLRHESAWDRHSIEQRLLDANVPSSVRAGLTQAMVDWMGKMVGQPVWRVLGLNRTEVPLTSVTIGIGSPESTRTRVKQWRELHDFRAFKVKLGSTDGIRADQAAFEAVQDEIGQARISVDANGGWSETEACEMSRWLHARGVDHLEQPLPRGQEAGLRAVRRASSLPLIADESCRHSFDIPQLSQLVDGVNIKLPKCGGFDEALRTIAAARASGMRILLGCYGSSCLGNSAAAALGPLADYLDLDSHLNLADDPFRGAELQDGCLLPSKGKGFGISYGD